MRAGALAPASRLDRRARLATAVFAATLAAVLVSLASAGPTRAKPANIVVNTASDTFNTDGLCSLREAITASNTTAAVDGCIAGTNEIDADSIRFNLGTGVPTINIAFDLPQITKPVGIYGNTNGATRVRLQAPALPDPDTFHAGLAITSLAHGSAVDHLEIAGFPTGLQVDADGVIVRSSVIVASKSYGIVVNPTATGVTIGGTTGVTPGGACTGHCNVITGNANGGIWLGGGATVLGNMIGLNAAGTTADPNGAGIEMGWSTAAAVIGGTTAAAANTISGNELWGVIVEQCTSCLIQGNRIGTTPAGTAARPNGLDGIYLQDVDGVVIGGDGAGAGNVVSGNARNGIFVEDSNDTIITGNWVGVSRGGSAIGNGDVGVLISGFNVPANDNVVGAATPGAGNTVAYNGNFGVVVTYNDGSAARNTIRGNSIFNNDLKGIQLDIPNVPAAPSVTGLRPVRGAGGCPGCLVDIYSDNADEGRVYEGTAVADAFGAWSLPGLFAGPNVTATVTDVDGDTSEFSAPLVPTTPFTDIADSPFETEITWLYANGITTGCTATTYCPTGSVTREQMASFLVRMFSLPGTGTDYFTDDETSVHEGDINRLRAAEITTGCAATLFCPKGQVLRDQMASFLARAAGLTTGAGRDYFGDDDGNSHEANIDRNAAAGLTTGCGAYTYCPSGQVTREQMAAYLRRILVPLTAPPYPAP